MTKKKSNKRKFRKSHEKKISKMEYDRTFTTLTPSQVSQTSSSKEGQYIDYFAYYLYSLYKKNLLIQKRIVTRKIKIQEIKSIKHPMK
jgi:hypothetical protein